MNKALLSAALNNCGVWIKHCFMPKLKYSDDKLYLEYDLDENRKSEGGFFWGNLI